MINVANNWLWFVEDLYSAKMNSVKVIDKPIKELRTIYIYLLCNHITAGTDSERCRQEPCCRVIPICRCFHIHVRKCMLGPCAFLCILILSPCRFVKMFCCVELLWIIRTRQWWPLYVYMYVLKFDGKMIIIRVWTALKLFKKQVQIPIR